MSTQLTTDKQLAERYGKGLWFVQSQCRKKAWPHMRVGKSIRFTDEQVAAIDAQMVVDTAAAEPLPAPGRENPWGRKGRSA